MTTATTLIADYYTGPTRARFLGLQAGFMGLGGVVFLSFGGILADISWRKPFLIYLVALGLLPLIVLLLPEPKQEIVSTSGGSTPVAEPDRFPWGLMSVTYGIAVISQTIFYLIPVQLPFFLKALVNATAAQSGLAIALCTFFSSISAVLYQQVKARLSFMTIYAIAFLLIWGGFWGIGFANAYGPVLLSLAFAGLGLGLLMPNMNVCLTSVAPTTLRGRVLGGLTTSFFLGQFLSPLFSQPLSQVVGLGNTYILSGGLLLIMALLAFASTLRWT
jgi:MFS family permease